MNIQWTPRRIPRPAAGMAAYGQAAQQLAEKLLARLDEELECWRGVSGQSLLVVLGETEVLPWVDGACYIAPAEASGFFWLPTTFDPSVPVPLVERALRHQFPKANPPIVLLPAWNTVLSLAEARPIARATLKGFIQRF